MLPPSREYLEREIENVLAAYNVARKELLDDPELPFSVARLCEYNRLILEATERACRRSAHSEGSYVPAEDAEHPQTHWLNVSDGSSPDWRRSLWRSSRQSCAHLYLAWIHRSGTATARTARLLELQILLSAGFPVPTCQLLSNHYNLTRSEYYRQLALSSREKDGVLSFMHYAIQGFVDQLREQLDVIRSGPVRGPMGAVRLPELWRRRSETDNRRLRLVLDLSREFHAQGEAISKQAIPRSRLAWRRPTPPRPRRH